MADGYFTHAKALQDAYARARRERVPTLAMVRSAYAEDDLEIEDLERLVEAALTSTKTEIPEPMMSRFFPPTMIDVLKEVWTADAFSA
jgi:hypothetical protein